MLLFRSERERERSDPRRCRGRFTEVLGREESREVRVSRRAPAKAPECEMKCFIPLLCRPSVALLTSSVSSTGGILPHGSRAEKEQLEAVLDPLRGARHNSARDGRGCFLARPRRVCVFAQCNLFRFGNYSHDHISSPSTHLYARMTVPRGTFALRWLAIPQSVGGDAGAVAVSVPRGTLAAVGWVVGPH
jgi:hypothetical protein